MKRLDIKNPFGAPVWHEEKVGSTMDESRRLAAEGAPHGTVISAGFQEAGRGRIRTRPWKGTAGESLAFTILLRFGSIEGIPPAFTLRAALALLCAMEDFAPPLKGRVLVKWPNDIMITLPSGCRKAAGILSESDGKTVYTGIGVNVTQPDFPPELRYKAVSIGSALKEYHVEAGALNPFLLLEKILRRLHAENEDGSPAWKDRLEARLYRRGEEVCFLPGAAEAAEELTGILQGITPEGGIILLPKGKTNAESFITGELKLYE
ncbi:MAG: biotin--[acetyl-CoA-carboxylase] ligase [Treponema sp.]|jgi:BirA family biotin operon repressor/biotin-[acetyl-CoA-carboxylase] ligase|nr:biotin--[acetyl-CoA-carboxylase] ligase [Treponema sp.]